MLHWSDQAARALDMWELNRAGMAPDLLEENARVPILHSDQTRVESDTPRWQLEQVPSSHLLWRGMDSLWLQRDRRDMGVLDQTATVGQARGANPTS